MRSWLFLALLVGSACAGGGFQKMPDGGTCVASTPGPYVACGCGCCGGLEPGLQCLYHAKGDCLQAIIDQDETAAANPGCAMAGCSFPVKYQYCD